MTVSKVCRRLVEFQGPICARLYPWHQWQGASRLETWWETNNIAGRLIGLQLSCPQEMMETDQDTQRSQFVWPVSVASGVSVRMSHSLRVASPPPVASWLPSGLNAAISTASVCPASLHERRRWTDRQTERDESRAERSRAEQREAEQSREKQSRAERSRAEQSREKQQNKEKRRCDSGPCIEAVQRVAALTRKTDCYVQSTSAHARSFRLKGKEGPHLRLIDDSKNILR